MNKKWCNFSPLGDAVLSPFKCRAPSKSLTPPVSCLSEAIDWVRAWVTTGAELWGRGEAGDEEAWTSVCGLVGGFFTFIGWTWAVVDITSKEMTGFSYSGRVCKGVWELLQTTMEGIAGKGGRGREGGREREAGRKGEGGRGRERGGREGGRGRQVGREREGEGGRGRERGGGGREGEGGGGEGGRGRERGGGGRGREREGGREGEGGRGEGEGGRGREREGEGRVCICD